MGCHWNRRAAVYQCHRGALAGQEFSNKREAREALAAAGSPVASPREVEPRAPGYWRDLYGGWIDGDGDCQDTRQEVLIEESLVEVQLTPDSCRVLSGEWRDPFTGRVFTDPGALNIDHLVPLAEVHRSGGHARSRRRWRAYANDLSNSETLIAVSRSANRSKGDKDPAGRLPPREAFHCDYVAQWLRVKKTWNLAMDDAEAGAIERLLANCARGGAR